MISKKINLKKKIKIQIIRNHIIIQDQDQGQDQEIDH